MDQLEHLINLYSRAGGKLTAFHINQLFDEIEDLTREADHELSYIYTQFSKIAKWCF